MMPRGGASGEENLGLTAIKEMAADAAGTFRQLTADTKISRAMSGLSPIADDRHRIARLLTVREFPQA